MPRSVHTKSTSGRTHRLTNGGRFVELRYNTTPQFDDQVQGDLWRKARGETGVPWPWPSSGMATVDKDLDVNERDASRLTPKERAQQVLDAHRIRDDWRRSGDQIRALLIEAVEIERAEQFTPAGIIEKGIRDPDNMLVVDQNGNHVRYGDI